MLYLFIYSCFIHLFICLFQYNYQTLFIYLNFDQFIYFYSIFVHSTIMNFYFIHAYDIILLMHLFIYLYPFNASNMIAKIYSFIWILIKVIISFNLFILQY